MIHKLLKKERDNNKIPNNFLNPGVPRPFLELKIRSTKGLICFLSKQDLLEKTNQNELLFQ